MKLSDIDLRLLRVFQAVATAGGFAKAQSALGISQPAISAQIAKLEDRLSVRLCDRGPKGFALTEGGTAVLRETTELLNQIDAAAARLNSIGAPPAKRARIGVVDCMITDPSNPLVSTLRDLRRDVPDLRIQIGIYDFLECIEELRANRLDIAIVGISGTERIPSEAEALPLYEETSSLYCAPDHPCAAISNPDELRAALAKADISAHSFAFNPIDKDLDPMLLDQSNGVAEDTIELTAYLTLCGSHVGLLPDHYASIWLKAGDLVQVATQHNTIVSEFHAVRLRPNAYDAALNAVWASLKSNASSSSAR